MAEGGLGGEEPRLAPGCGALRTHCLDSRRVPLASGPTVAPALSSPH